MDIETGALHLNKLVSLAYKQPFQAMDELASIAPPLELLHLRDAVLLHVASLCMSGLNPVAAKNIELRAAQRQAKIRITRTVELHVLMLFAQGTSQKDIARVMALSGGTVNALIRGKYPFSESEAVKARESLGEEMEKKLKVARDALFARGVNSIAKQEKNKKLLTQVNNKH